MGRASAWAWQWRAPPTSASLRAAPFSWRRSQRLACARSRGWIGCCRGSWERGTRLKCCFRRARFPGGDGSAPRQTPPVLLRHKRRLRSRGQRPQISLTTPAPPPGAGQGAGLPQRLDQELAGDAVPGLCAGCTISMFRLIGRDGRVLVTYLARPNRLLSQGRAAAFRKAWHRDDQGA